MASDGTTAARLLVEVQGRGINETAAGLGRMDTAVRGAGMGIGKLAVAAGGIYAVKKAFDATIGSAISWESEFAGVEKTVDASDAELAKLEGTLLSMHRTMPVARADLAGIAEAAGALGIASPDIAEFTETVAMIGETTNVTADAAASALGKLSNVLGLTVDDYDNFGAALVDLGNKGASTEQEILGIAEQAGAGAALVGLAADATLGWASAVANLGIEAQAGGSSLQTFFLKTTEHVGKAGAELEGLAQTAGMSSSEFARAFNEDASGALEKFIGGLAKLSQAQQIAMLELLGFGDIRITRTILGLAGNVDNLSESLDIGAQGWKENTALTVEYGKRAQTTAAKIEVLGNRFGDLGRRMGEAQGGPVDFAIGAVDLSLSGWEKNFIDLELQFGAHGDRINALAEREYGDLGQRMANGWFGPDIKNEIKKNMLEYGMSAEEVISIMEKGLTPALAEQGTAWEAYQKQISQNSAAVGESAGDMAEAVTEGLEGVTEATAEELAEAREAAIEGMAGIMDATLNLGNKDDYAAAWEDYLSGADEVFTDDARSKAIAGQFAGDAFNDALHSGDSARVEETVTFVNDQLAAFELMNPGVLQIGKDVPANLQAGMAEIWPELEQYVMDQTGKTLENLSLAEAEKLGVEGIALLAQGMEINKLLATGTADDIAIETARALWIDASPGGKSIIATWIAGMNSGWDEGINTVYAITNAAGRILGQSLPTEGPLKGGVASGGQSIGDSWVVGLSRSLDSGLGGIDELLGRFQRSLNDLEGDTGAGAWSKRQNLLGMQEHFEQIKLKAGESEAEKEARIRRDLAGLEGGTDPGDWTRRQNLLGKLGEFEDDDPAVTRRGPHTVNINLTVQGDLRANESTLPGTLKRAVYASGLVVDRG